MEWDKLLRKYTNEQSRFLVVDGTLVHYRDEGRGYPLLLLHGAFSSLHTFDGWVDELSSKFRVLRLDLPGFGLTGPNIENDYTMPTHKRFVRTFLERMEVEECFVAGSSLGGWVAWELALKYPEQFKKLILIGAAGFLDENSIPLPFKMARTPFLNQVVKYVIRKNIFEQFLYQVYYDEEKVTRELVDRYYDLFSREGNPEAFLKLVNARVRDNTMHLKEIKAPTLIMWGAHDKWLPVENATRFHQVIPNSELIIYEDLGHIPMEECPFETARDARKFLLNHKHPAG